MMSAIYVISRFRAFMSLIFIHSICTLLFMYFEQGCLNHVQCSHKLDTHNIKCP